MPKLSKVNLHIYPISPKSMGDKVDFLPANKCQRFLQSDTAYLSVCVWRDIIKITSLLFLWFFDLIFCLQISMKACYKLIMWFWWGWSSIFKVLKLSSLQYLYNISKKKLEFIFCMQIKFGIKHGVCFHTTICIFYG